MIEKRMDVFSTGWQQEGHLASKSLHQLVVTTPVSSWLSLLLSMQDMMELC